MGVTCRVWSLSEGGSEDSEREREGGNTRTRQANLGADSLGPVLAGGLCEGDSGRHGASLLRMGEMRMGEELTDSTSSPSMVSRSMRSRGRGRRGELRRPRLLNLLETGLC
jgi:hypothetical protein